jgi:cyclase
MLTKRIIPCLDIKNDRVVKGSQFLNLKDAGDPLELAKFYSQNGADELVFLDITATNQKRKTLVDLVTKISSEINIPFCVGGGINSLEIISDLLEAGADKISLNSAAVKNPDLIKTASKKFGNQCIVIAVDYKTINHKNTVVINSGNLVTEYELEDWCRLVQKNGAGEILLTSMNQDGQKTGYDAKTTIEIAKILDIPVIASGGAGSKEDFYEVLNSPVSGALAASIFHYKEVLIPDLKKYLQQKGVAVRV